MPEILVNWGFVSPPILFPRPVEMLSPLVTSRMPLMWEDEDFEIWPMSSVRVSETVLANNDMLL
jgi:hypothetical protein